MQSNTGTPVFFHYWGSHFKTSRQVEVIAVLFRPLVSRGWRCYLGIERLPECDGWLNPMRDMGVEIHCLPRPESNFDLVAVSRIASFCRSIGCSVFQCDNLATAPLMGAMLARVPVRIWYKRSMNSSYESCRPPNFRDRLALSTRLSCFLASHVVGISSAVGIELRSLGLQASKLFVHNNPRPEWSGRPPGREIVRRELGYNPDDLVLLAVGRAEPVKAWDILVTAFTKFADSVPQAHLLLVGSISSSKEREFMNALQVELSHNRLGERVHFVGQVNDIQPFLAAADLFVMPSRSEGCSNALVEALGAGLPCIATNVGSASELLGDHPAGLLVRRNDCEDLAEKLKWVTSDNERRIAMAAEARIPDHVLSRQAHAERRADYYDSILALSARRGGCEAVR